jgi:LuxR family maltose regulon positive regulatory protein
MTVLQALPGHGKTSLVRHWAEQQRARGAVVTWAGDPRTVDLGSLAPEPTSDSTVSILVVDDVHRWSTAGVEALCEAVLRSANLHVVACADGPSGIVEAARRRYVQTEVVNAADLTVSAADLVDFARSWGHQISMDDALDLHDRLGGWLRPVWEVLDAQARTGGRWVGDPAGTFARGRVLTVLADTGDLDVVSRLAITPVLTEPLAMALLDAPRDETRAVLSRLVAFGMLERLPAERGVSHWRTRGLLREAVARETADTATHRTVARSLLELGDAADLPSVLHHARLGRDWEVLAQLWTTRTFVLVAHLPLETAAAYAGLPVGALTEFPVLGIPTAMADAALTASADRHDRNVLRGFAAAGRRALVARDLPGETAVRSIAVAATLMSLRAEGGLDAALRLASAHDRELTDKLTDRGGTPWTRQSTAWFLLTWGLAAAHSADYVTAFGLLDRSFEVAQLAGSRSLAKQAAGHLAMLHTAIGATARGSRWLSVHDRLAAAEAGPSARPSPSARLCRAILALDRMDGELADAELSRLDPTTDEDIWPFILTASVRRAVLFGDATAMLARVDELADRHASEIVDATLARRAVARARADLLLALGEVDRARAVIEAEPALAAWLRVPTARLALMTDRPGEAALLASSGVWEESVSLRDGAELHMITAAARFELGDVEGAGAAFERGHALAMDVGTATPYAVMPARARGAIVEHGRLQLPPWLVTALDRVPSPYPERSQPVILSPREREVLRLMAQDATTTEMAQQLTVSVNTLKKQRASIYSKLDVHAREDALVRATELGLLP